MSTLVLSDAEIQRNSEAPPLLLSQKAAAAIVCRMSSSRLPGKTLAQVGGKPLVSYIVDALQHVVPFLEIALVTSCDSTDDPIAEYGRERGLKVIRGPLEDVAARFAVALRELDANVVFRVNGDSPLFPVGVFPFALRRSFADGWDLVTNISPRTFPPGMSVELVRTAAFLGAQPGFSDPREREHVTFHFYNHPRRYRILNLALPSDRSQVSMAIDTEEDMRAFERLIAALDKPHWTCSVDDLINLQGRIRGSGRSY